MNAIVIRVGGKVVVVLVLVVLVVVVLVDVVGFVLVDVAGFVVAALVTSGDPVDGTTPLMPIVEEGETARWIVRGAASTDAHAVAETSIAIPIQLDRIDPALQPVRVRVGIVPRRAPDRRGTLVVPASSRRRERGVCDRGVRSALTRLQEVIWNSSTNSRSVRRSVTR